MATPVIDFFHHSGHRRVRADLDAVMASASQSLRAAVCFFTGAGFRLLRRHVAELTRPESFFVASVDYPTDLDALDDLNALAPGKVYIHLGGTTPKEKRVGRALMHSKVILATAATESQLWIGSHNFTGQGILGGNIEAGVRIIADTAYPAIQDAATHLDVCRITAEPFEPAQMQRYRDIQNERLPLPPWIVPARFLVIHAETNLPQPTPPFTAHLCVEPVDFDDYFDLDREVRLYLHPIGALKRGVPASFHGTTMWTGSITGVNRTAAHPFRHGVRGDFTRADYDLDLPNVVDAPTLVTTGTARARSTSQVVLSMEAEGSAGGEEYSLDAKPVVNSRDADEAGQEVSDADADMRMYFTPESIRDGNLVYRSVRGMKQVIKVAGYRETMRTSGQSLVDEKDPVARSVEYEEKAPQRPVDAFMFVTKHLIDRQRK
jgi:hypothetical protein